MKERVLENVLTSKYFEEAGRADNAPRPLGKKYFQNDKNILSESGGGEMRQHGPATQ